MTAPLARLFLLDPKTTYLNHGSYGACPRPVFAAYRRWQRRLEVQPEAFMEPAALSRRFMKVRHDLAAEIGANPEDIVNVMNATAGLNVIARSLPLEPGDEILTTDHEYAALEKTWTFVAARTGAVIRQVTVPLPLTSEAAFTDAVLSEITQRTRVLFLSHVTSPTALVLPVARVIARARTLGILTVIDGAHAPGLVPLNLEALGADFYVGNCHKWLLSPKGAGFLHARRECQQLLEPAVISHGWTATAETPGPFGQSAFVDRFQWQGTQDPAAWLSVPSALQFRQDHDWATVVQRCARLVRETASHMSQMTGLAPLSSSDFSTRQMVSIPIPDVDPAALRSALKKRGIEIPVFRWGGRCLIRLSVQGYNDSADMKKLIDALAAELRSAAPISANRI